MPASSAKRKPKKMKKPKSTTEPTAALAPRSVLARRPWILVIMIFAVQIAVWTGWILFASKHRVAEVPLAGAAGSKR